jgi:DNA-binding response OmpR family regulator
VLERAGIRLDADRRTVTRDGEHVPLSRKEFAVLAELLRAGGGVVSAEQLLEKAWDEHTDPFTGVVRFTIMMVRRKLGDPSVSQPDKPRNQHVHQWSAAPPPRRGPQRRARQIWSCS